MRPRARRRINTQSSLPGIDHQRRHRPDYMLIVITLVLVAIGLVIIYSISPALAVTSGSSSSHFVEKQLLAIALAAIVFVVASRIPLVSWRRYSKSILILAALATLVALVLPVNPAYPAHRWVRLGGLSFQSVELLKFALLLWLAGLFVSRSGGGDKMQKFANIFKPMVILLLLVGVIVAGLQKDLGSAGVILVMTFTMAFIVGVPLKKVGVFVAIIALVGVVAIAIEPYRMSRLDSFLHPSQNCQTAAGYQACQALISVGSGGMFGQGLGRGVQAYGYLPQADNDSIFAIYAEKFGFIGCLLLLALYGALFSRVQKIAERAPDDYSRLVAFGVLAWLAVETLINIGGMIGVMPMKGITLPFISYGGTSIIFSAAAVGLVFQISRYTSLSSPRVRSDNKEAGFANNRDRRRLGRPHYAADSYRR